MAERQIGVAWKVRFPNRSITPHPLDEEHNGLISPNPVAYQLPFSQESGS